MAHPHNIADRDPYFVIDPVTRAIVNKTNKKITLMQFDHNSERFTFEIPRMIEGHDMSLCDRIEVHYLNIENATKTTNKGVYEVKDAQVLGSGDDAVVVGSWLISQNATKLVGNLSFTVRYACTANDGSLVYVWSSAIYSSINISNGIYNSEDIVEQYADVLEQWKTELAIADITDLRKDLDQTADHVKTLEDRVNDILSDKAFTVNDGKVCTESAEVSGAGWDMAEAAAKLDTPYLKEYGWQCVRDSDRDRALYEWIYRCMKEGFSVPYRTVVVDGVEHRFATELTERDREWLNRATDPVTGRTPFETLEVFNGVDRSEATYFCIPLVQFGDMTDQELVNAIARVRMDNPALCLPPIEASFIVRDEDGKARYCACAYNTERQAEVIAKLVDQATQRIAAEVKRLVGVEMGDSLDETQKKKVAQIIHDYIVITANPASVEGAGGDYRPFIYQGTMYSAIDKAHRGLCAGYVQAFNYFARLYGINSIAITANVWHVNGSGDLELGGHAWNALNFTRDYGDYPSDPAEWTQIDVYWDEPLHELEISGEQPDGDVHWLYFCQPRNIDAYTAEDDPDEEAWVRIIDTTTSYGGYPFGDAVPSKNYDGHDENEYLWEE